MVVGFTNTNAISTYNNVIRDMVRALVFNVTFNNIFVISWWSVLLVEETRVPEENHVLPQVTDKYIT
jgi:hypothetical protein